MGKILPVILALIGLGGGVGAGLMLRPEPQEITMINPCGAPEAEHAGPGSEPEDEDAGRDYVKLNNQFVVPVVRDGKIESLVVMSLSLEVGTGQTEAVYQREPKLRDAFLRVMFDHANAGGFSGAFTNPSAMSSLRTALREVAQKTLGTSVKDVLIMDIIRQDA